MLLERITQETRTRRPRYALFVFQRLTTQYMMLLNRQVDSKRLWENNRTGSISSVHTHERQTQILILSLVCSDRLREKLKSSWKSVAENFHLNCDTHWCQCQYPRRLKTRSQCLFLSKIGWVIWFLSLGSTARKHLLCWWMVWPPDQLEEWSSALSVCPRKPMRRQTLKRKESSRTEPWCWRPFSIFTLLWQRNAQLHAFPNKHADSAQSAKARGRARGTPIQNTLRTITPLVWFEEHTELSRLSLLAW